MKDTSEEDFPEEFIDKQNLGNKPAKSKFDREQHLRQVMEKEGKIVLDEVIGLS